MTRHRWHILRDGQDYTLARHLPPRFDVQAQAEMPMSDPGRLARQIRQDMWRLLKDLRGFSPVVHISPRRGGIVVTAGGRMAQRQGRARVSHQIATLLNDPGLRARWLGWAGQGAQR